VWGLLLLRYLFSTYPNLGLDNSGHGRGFLFKMSSIMDVDAMEFIHLKIHP